MTRNIIARMTKLYQDKTQTQTQTRALRLTQERALRLTEAHINTKNICLKKYKTRSVTKTLANIKPNSNPNINPTVLKYHKYIPNLESSISGVRKNLNIKNLKIKIPINIL